MSGLSSVLLVSVGAGVAIVSFFIGALVARATDVRDFSPRVRNPFRGFAEGENTPIVTQDVE